MACTSHVILINARLSTAFCRVATIAVVHGDDMFVVELKSRCDAFRDELNVMVPVKGLSELRRYVGYYYSWDRERGTVL